MTEVRDETDLVAARMVRPLRSALGWTQTELAATVGATQSIVSEYERGPRQPSLGVLIRWCVACGKELRLGMAERDPHDELLASCLSKDVSADFAAEQRTAVSAIVANELADDFLW